MKVIDLIRELVQLNPDEELSFILTSENHKILDENINGNLVSIDSYDLLECLKYKNTSEDGNIRLIKK